VASAFSVSGLASNIDTKSMIEQLVYLDRAPARIAESNRSKAQTKLDSFKTMNTRLLAFKDALDGVQDGATFAGRTATSAKPEALTATATSAAVLGGMKISVKNLATASQYASAGQTSATTTVASGSLAFRLASTPAGSPDIVVTPTTLTMTGLAEAINAAKAGISASVVNDGTGTPYRLVLTSSESGLANAIASVAGTGGFATIIPDLAGMTKVADAEDAEIRLGDPVTGLQLFSASNDMADAIPGVTLKLAAEADGIDVTVANDGTAAKTAVQALVDSYNSARDYFNANSTYDVATKVAGALFGDYDLRSRINGLEQGLDKTYTGLPSGFDSLADVGVTIGSDGKMEIDTSVLDSKLAEDPEAVSGLFAAASGAITTDLDYLTRSTDGVLALKQSTLEDRIEQLNDRITAIDARLERRKAYYQAKFLAMEKITAQMQSQGSSLTSFISGLSKSSN
jgi:flagellar hook-associated protein 2